MVNRSLQKKRINNKKKKFEKTPRRRQNAYRK